MVSVNDDMGDIVKIEKVDETTGQRKELTQEEYAAAYGFAMYVAPYYTTYTSSPYNPLSNPAVQGYLKAMADYLRAFTTGR